MALTVEDLCSCLAREHALEVRVFLGTIGDEEGVDGAEGEEE